jgi:hypothetical protein
MRRNGDSFQKSVPKIHVAFRKGLIQ